MKVKVIEKMKERFFLMSHRVLTVITSLGVSAATAASTNDGVWSGDVQAGLDALDRAISLAVVIGLVIVAIGFVIGAVKFFHDDAHGAKDVLLKCFVAGAVVAIAPTLVKFIVGSFTSRNIAQELSSNN